MARCQLRRWMPGSLSNSDAAIKMGVDGRTAERKGESWEEMNMCLEGRSIMSLLMTVNLSVSQGATAQDALHWSQLCGWY